MNLEIPRTGRILLLAVALGLALPFGPVLGAARIRLVRKDFR